MGHLASAHAGCRYCEAHTVLAAKRFGASHERLAELWNFRASSLFSAAEKAAFEFALAAASIPNAVDETIAAELYRHWSDDEIVEILGVVALFGFLAPAPRCARRSARSVWPEHADDARTVHAEVGLSVKVVCRRRTPRCSA